jgi:hypothetical protein
MKKLEKSRRNVQPLCLLGKMTIMLTIVDNLTCVVNLIEYHIMEEAINEYVQSHDIVTFKMI